MAPDNLSCVIITLNEEENIADCIDSVLHVCKEIIVVDSHSTDKTVEIATQKGAIIINQAWTGYADARNVGHQAASHDFILAIDADERLSPELIRSIKSLQPESNTVYLVNRLNYFAGKPIHHSGWFPDYVKRLYNRTTAQWKGNYVHEQLVSENLNTITLSGILHHFSYTSKKDHEKRLEKYARLSAEKMLHDGKSYNPVLKYMKAAYRYFRTLVLKKGILDGKLGFYIARQDYRLLIKKFNYLKELEEKRSK